jgi:hypothetical protein
MCKANSKACILEEEHERDDMTFFYSKKKAVLILLMSAHSPAGTSHPTRLYNDQVYTMRP